MKRIIAYLLLMLISGIPTLMAQSSDNMEPKLRQANQIPGVDYTYISPWMLSSMRENELKNLIDVPVKKVRHIEILKTKRNGLDSRFSSLVNKLSNEDGFKLVGYNKDDQKGVKICVDSSESKDAFGCPIEIINRILVIQWVGSGYEHQVVYIVGQFSKEDVSSLFHF